jgi:hypothetical protein
VNSLHFNLNTGLLSWSFLVYFVLTWHCIEAIGKNIKKLHKWHDLWKGHFTRRRWDNLMFGSSGAVGNGDQDMGQGSEKSQTTDKRKSDRKALRNSVKFILNSFQSNLCFILNFLIYVSLVVWIFWWLIENMVQILGSWIPCAYEVECLGLWLIKFKCMIRIIFSIALFEIKFLWLSLDIRMNLN